MDDAQSAVLQDFMSITGVDDAAAATVVLDATAWVLEDAVNLQLATGGDLGGGSTGATGATAAGAPLAAPLDEEEVRAPLPVVRDRLYGDFGGPQGAMPRVTRYGGAQPDRTTPPHVDVFARDAPTSSGAAAAAGSAAPASAADATGSGAAKLSELFRPPEGLAFPGDWDAAVAAAARDGRWLLLNVQSADEFASHQLNRDTWGQPLVQDMLRGSFVFWQCFASSETGAALANQYHLVGLPAVAVVDPITRAKLWERDGFVPADALVEELVPYMDVGPNDPGATELAQRAYQQSAKRRNRGGGSSGSGLMTEDEQLALALAMSVEGTVGNGRGPSAAAAGASGSSDDGLDEDAIWQEVQRRQREEADAAARRPSSPRAPVSTGTAAAAAAAAPAPVPVATAAPPEASAAPGADAHAAVEAAQLAAAGRLPPEPQEGAVGACRVAFRLPDGQRLQRRFLCSDAVQALQDYVVASSAEVAAMPGFALAEARPGAPSLVDADVTLQDVGVAGAMLVVRGL